MQIFVLGILHDHVNVHRRLSFYVCKSTFIIHGIIRAVSTLIFLYVTIWGFATNLFNICNI